MVFGRKPAMRLPHVSPYLLLVLTTLHPRLRIRLNR